MTCASFVLPQNDCHDVLPDIADACGYAISPRTLPATDSPSTLPDLGA
jgi:hypothetical protein